jgi:hypothetical protein
MDLKSFISSTLVQIQEGVQDAIDQTTEKGLEGSVNPKYTVSNNPSLGQTQDVKFDIAVTASDEDKAGVNGGIKVVGISFGGDASSTTKMSQISRIQFSIPVTPPTTHIQKKPSKPLNYT